MCATERNSRLPGKFVLEALLLGPPCRISSLSLNSSSSTSSAFSSASAFEPAGNKGPGQRQHQQQREGEEAEADADEEGRVLLAALERFAEEKKAATQAGGANGGGGGEEEEEGESGVGNGGEVCAYDRNTYVNHVHAYSRIHR